MSADEDKKREERAFEALIVSQLRSECGDRLELEKLPQLSDEEREVMQSFGDDFMDRLFADTADRPMNQHPARRSSSERRELAHGLNRADEIDDEAREELRRKREEALNELEEGGGGDGNSEARD